MNKLLMLITAIVIAAVALFFSFRSENAPTASFHTIDGQTIQSEQLKGKVYLVKFWATTCVTCVRQMPDTIRYYQTYKERGYDTIAVAMSYDPVNAVEKFTQSYQLPFPVALDQGGVLAKQFGHVRFTPVAFLIDRKGRIVKRFIGDYNKTEFIQILEQTLAQE